MVIVADVEYVFPFWVKLAVRMTFPGGGLSGAVYKPSVVMDPHAPWVVVPQLSEKTMPVTGFPLLVTVNCCCAPASIVRLEGLIARFAPSVIVTVASALFVASAAATAVIVTVAGFGTVAGAV
jgi:hypothetical protein